MRTLMALLNDVATAASVIEAAKLLSQRMPFDIRVVHPRPLVDPSFMPTEEIMTEARLRDFADQQDARSAALARIAADRMPMETVLQEIDGKFGDVVETVLRDNDLVIAGTACGTDRLEARETIAQLLRQRRIPILVVPSTVPVSVGSRPGIAWKPGLQVEAAIASMGRLLGNTDQLHILRGTEQEGGDAELERMISVFAARGIRVDSSVFDPHGRHAGEALMTAARQANCDLLIMGTHTHGWMSSMLVEGLSEKALANTEMPILLHA